MHMYTNTYTNISSGEHHYDITAVSAVMQSEWCCRGTARVSASLSTYGEHALKEAVARQVPRTQTRIQQRLSLSLYLPYDCKHMYIPKYMTLFLAFSRFLSSSLSLSLTAILLHTYVYT